MLRDDNQQKAVAADLKGLRDISSKNQEDLLNLSKRLTQAEAERFANPLTYALSGVSVILLLLVIALFAKLRGNSANDTPWWRGSSKVDEDDEEEDVNLQDAKAHLEHSVVSSDSTPAKAATETSQNLRLLNGAQPLQNTDIDIDLDLGGPEVAEAPIASKSKPSNAVSGNSGYPRDFSHSLNASLHAINTQEMLDVRQQADFFMTLGQHEEAIGLLENSIRESEASNPLVYIDLLKVLHTLSRKPAFDHYRNEFNTIFTGWAPQYSVFGQPGNSLDAYPQICAEISQVWGTESASEFLEQCMVRSPEDAPEHYFDLDAFRDLLMLHAIAARIGPHSASDSSFMPFSAVRTVANPNPVAAQVSVPATAESVSSVNTTQELTAVAHPISNGSSSTASNLIDFDASEL
ncbi:MAG: hypothetical protein CFE44_11195 [Burkholderiales bacterium PBB4]|nr:MAG: hypothetical protein CFE44_11195 [Burkholderiales bacterium PBB4]